MSSLAGNDDKLKKEFSRESSNAAESQLSEKNAAYSTEPTPEQLALERSGRRKLDLTLMPVMTIFYLCQYLGQTNIGNARVAGLQNSLKLTDHQFQVALTIFYVPYTLSELPSNLLMKRIGPNILLPAIVTLWGIVVLFQGFLKNYHGLLTARFFVGLLEGPMFPGITLYLSGFYTRADLSLRIAYFFSVASLAGAFSGLLAAAIQQMDGMGGKNGWEWIFILEGLFSVVGGIASFWLVPAGASQTILSPAEQQALTERLRRDRPTIGMEEVFNPREILRALQSPQLYPLFLIFFFGGAVFFGVAIFLPYIIFQMEFTATQSQLMSVGPFATAFFVSLLTAWISDKYKLRGIPIIVLGVICGVGWIMFYVSKSVWVSYGSFFLIVPGVFSPSPLAAAWLTNNSEGYYRRASSIALGFMATNVGAILSLWRFPSSEAPRFVNTTIMSIIFAFLMAASAGVNIGLLAWMQAKKRKNRDSILEPFITAENPDGGEKAWVELGDKHPDFKYAL